MADVVSFDPIAVPTKRRTRKPLNPRNSSQNESDIVAGAISQPPFVPENSAGKENSETLSQHKSPKMKKSGRGKKHSQPDPPATFSFEKELQEMQEKLQKMTIEKQQAEELLKLKEQELESHSREQEKVKMELKKLQKLKEFKPTMTLPLLHSLKDKDQVKKKKKKGCPETKKPATPYIMWCKEHWTEVKKEKPEAEFSKIANILGSKWKMITPEEKKPYEEKYQIEKAAYSKIVGNEKRENEAMKLLEEEQKQKTAMELLEQYLQFKQEAEKEGGDNKKNKKEKDPLKPKRPESAYFLFMNERRAALIAENKSVVEIAKITGEEWKNMTEKQKGCYEKKAKKKNEKYNQEMEVYKQNKEEEAENAKKEEEEVLKILKQEALQLLKKKEKTETIIKKTKEKKNKQKEEKKNKKTDDPNKPKRPPSSFLLFSKQARKDLAKEKPGISNAQLTALISVKWKELSEEEKQKWNGEAAEAMEAYKKEMEEYNKKNVTEIPN